ncbi:MAG: EamA family transporter [Actinomycetota bacterium]
MDKRDVLKTILFLAGFAAGWAALFLLVTVALGRMPSVVIAAGGLLFATILMTAFYARDAERTFRKVIREEPGLFAALAVGLWLAFACQVVNRYSAAPSGADTIFLLSSAPVFAAAITAARPGLKERLTWGSVAGALTALAGGMMIVANWERPSSFAPFAIFRLEELFLLASAAGLALFAVAGRKLTRKYSPAALLTAAFWVITPPTLIYGMLAGGGLYSLILKFAAGWLLLALIGVAALAVPLICLLEAVKKVPVNRALTAVAVMPALITVLIGMEHGFGFAYLPVPFAWAPILAGITIVIMGVAAVWTT